MSHDFDPTQKEENPRADFTTYYFLLVLIIAIYSYVSKPEEGMAGIHDIPYAYRPNIPGYIEDLMPHLTPIASIHPEIAIHTFDGETSPHTSFFVLPQGAPIDSYNQPIAADAVNMVLDTYCSAEGDATVLYIPVDPEVNIVTVAPATSYTKPHANHNDLAGIQIACANEGATP